MYVYETALILEQVAHELHGAYGEVSVPQYVKKDTLYLIHPAKLPYSIFELMASPILPIIDCMAIPLLWHIWSNVPKRGISLLETIS